MRLVREGDGVEVADVEVAASFFTRLRGLMFRRGLAPDAGIWIEPCSSIHMFFVNFPIDVAFARRLDASRQPVAGSSAEILAVRERVWPWLGLAWCRGASSTIELAAGRAAELGLRAGDRVRLEGAL
jgi:uncharacterized membrane protein (UPF0127 family)